MRQKRKEGSTERISSAKLNPVPATLFDVPKNDQTRLSDGSGISPGFREAGGKIRESEHLLRMVLDNSQDIFYCLNLQTGRYEYISPSAETTMGLSVGEFPAHDANSALAMIHPEDRSTVRAAYAELEKTGTAEVEYRQMTGSGEYRWLSNHLSLVRNKEGHPLFRTGHMTDISKRKHDERALRESEERFRLAARAGQAMIYDLDVGSLRINATHGMSDLLGFVPDEVDSTLQWWKSLINSDDLHFYHAAFEKMCSLHHDHILHYRVRRKDGREIWVEDHAAPVGKDGGELERIVGTVADITVRKRAEEALRISEEKFSKAFKNSPTAITITRLGDGRIIEGNDSSFAMFGFRAEEIIGKTTLEVGIWACPEDRKRLVSELSSKGIVKQREFVLQRKDRSLVTVDLSASLIIVENQQCLITSFVDITERKMAEDELRRSEDKFRRLATELTAINRDLDSFSYSVAHELRNPLNNINALFKLLLRDNRERLDENGDLCIDHIEKNIVRLASVISGLLGLSHVARHTLQIRKVDLTRIAWDATEQLRESDKKRQVDIIIQKNLIAEADENLMRVALNNLIGNAWKYSSRNERPRIEVGVTPDRGGSVYFVRDNGIGFSMKDTERIFLPFQRANSTEEIKGNGIGLSTVKRIVEKHGGRIWAQSEPGKGSTFYFTLEPQKEPPREPPTVTLGA